MRAALKNFSRSVSRPSSSWLTLLLLLVVLAPSACLLWFMNQAVKNERLAVRQKLVDAYRGHLVVAQQRLESYWRELANDLDAQAEILSPSARFHQEVFLGRADAVACFDSTGKLAYPSVAPPSKTEPAAALWSDAERSEVTDPTAAALAYGSLAQQTTNATIAARALQAQARCLARAGKKYEALSVLLGPLAEEQYRQVTDAQGRLVVPNAQLMALELLEHGAPEAARPLVEQLRKRVLDYDDPALAASQRRFLMRELQPFYRDVFGQPDPPKHILRGGLEMPFPDEPVLLMLSAEDLAAAYVEAGQLEEPKEGDTSARRASRPGLRSTSLPGVWQFASARGRVVLLHKSAEALFARTAGPAGLTNLPADVSVTLLPPGREADGVFVSLPAGPALPDWRLALSLKDQKLFDAATDQRVAAYVWFGVLVVVGVSVLAMLILRLVRRQMALTKLRNDLVANVTHELKTPLSGMRLLVETLLDSPTLHEPTVREYLALIAKENLRLSRLIDNFLAFSRMERNKYALDFKEVPAQSIVEGAADAVRERFNAPGCRFEIHLPPDLPPVVADADAMVTAVVNLLDNAWKYSGDEKHITLTASAANGRVRFAVQDNGVGLSPRDTKRIFKRFYQVDQRLARTAGGCGLGLSIVKFIVTAHGGEIRVESEPGRGSGFVITIPVAVAADMPVAKASTSKLQASEKSQSANPKSRQSQTSHLVFWCLPFLWCLGIGSWSFFPLAEGII